MTEKGNALSFPRLKAWTSSAENSVSSDMEQYLVEMDKITGRIAEHKDRLIVEALRETCAMKGCTARVRTARWVVEMGEIPMVERLVLMCDAGHEWYRKFSTKVESSKVTLRSVRFPVPFDADVFREMEAMVEESVPGTFPKEKL